MSEALAQVNNERNVTRLHSVGVTMPLGTMAMNELLNLEMNLVDRLWGCEPYMQPKLEQDAANVGAEIQSRLGW